MLRSGQVWIGQGFSRSVAAAASQKKFFIRARHMWAKTLAGIDRSDIPRHLVQSDFEPFPFQSGIIMVRFQSVGMPQYFQMSMNKCWV